MSQGAEEDANESGEPAGEENGSNRKRLKTLVWALMTLVATALVTYGVNQYLAGLNTYRIEVQVNTDAMGSPLLSGGGEYLIPTPIQNIGPPPINSNTCNGRYEWAHEQGGIDSTVTLVAVSVTALEGHSVQLVGARRVPVGAGRPPANGSVLTCPGRGAPPARQLYIDLDTDERVFYDGESDDPQPLNISIPSGATDQLSIIANTNTQDWSYRIELVLRVDGREVIEIVDNDGKPFRTTPPTNALRYQWIDGGWVDISSPAGTPVPVPAGPASIPDACTLITTEEASTVIGASLLPQSNFAVSPATTPGGGTGYSTFCSYFSADGESVQVSLLEASSPEEGRREYDSIMTLLSPRGELQSVQGYNDVTIVGEQSLLALQGAIVVQINIVHSDNQQNPFDSTRLQTLLDVVAPRIG